MVLEDLYGEIILDHYKNPRNHGALVHSSAHAHGFNESCGDDITVFLKVGDSGIIEDVTFEGQGCAISQSSASMMTERIKGKTINEAQVDISNLRKMVTGEGEFPGLDSYDELSALRGVSKFPMRVKCASLAWTTLQNAIEQYKKADSGSV